MKNKAFFKSLFILFLLFALLLGGCKTDELQCEKHTDEDNNGVCDVCYDSVFIYFDIFSVSNLFQNEDALNKIDAYIKDTQKKDRLSLLVSAGDMRSEKDSKISRWMSASGFAASAVGKSEYEAGIKNPSTPLLAINVIDTETQSVAVPYHSSVTVVSGSIKIGIIGAVSEDFDKSGKYDIKTGDALTALVKNEAAALKNDGVDFIIYLLHGGYGENTDSVNNVSKDDLADYYDTSLSDGYVDIVMEGGTGNTYRLVDEYGVYHIQACSSDAASVVRAEIAVNTVTEKASVRTVKITETDKYIINDISKDDAVSDEDSIPDISAPEISYPDNDGSACVKHKDNNSDTICDICFESVLVYIDFYSINDLHGKLADADSHPGVDELTTYLKNARKTDDYAFFLSAGDLWQGSAESNLTKGLILTDWMNELDFTASAIGNHEFDWGDEYIKVNSEAAEFPFLAINIYDRVTGELADYCQPSVTVEAGGVQIGIIGAIGDCYSSIATEKSQNVYFKVGSQLTTLVKNEADRLRKSGVDFIVYLIHDGYESSNYGFTKKVTKTNLASYYDTSLSDGYIDLVFEGHTHQGYLLQDEYGVYHLQNRGDNKGGISHAEIWINSVTNEYSVDLAEHVSHSAYTHLEDDPVVNDLLEKYDDIISPSKQVLGYNATYRNSDYLRQLAANLYYEAGEEMWGDKYNIVLGGGFLSVRSPYNLYAGDVTYADLQALFPFDNQLTLCSVKGRDLKNKFLETSNDDYFICCGDYGNSVKNNINSNETYYIIVDTYTAYYSPNKLTVVAEYTPDVYARDLLAEYIKNGGLS